MSVKTMYNAVTWSLGLSFLSTPIHNSIKLPHTIHEVIFMNNKNKYTIADLSENEEKDLLNMENNFSNSKGNKVVLVAYEVELH